MRSGGAGIADLLGITIHTASTSYDSGRQGDVQDLLGAAMTTVKQKRRRSA
jgi:hypothetical protein